MSIKPKDIERLHADGLITDEQKEQILAHYHSGTTSGRWLTICLSFLAVVLMLTGVGMLLYAHWAVLPSWSKVGTGLAALNLVWLGYFAFRKRFPILAEGFAALCGALWLCNLWILGLTYRTGAASEEIHLVFFAGLALIPFLSRQRLLLGIVAAASATLLVNLVVGVEPDSWLYIEAFYGAGREGNIAAAMAALMIFWWLVGERSSGSRGISRGYGWIGIVAMSILLFMAQLLLLHVLIREPDANFAPSGLGYGIMGATALLAMLMKPRGLSWLNWVAVAGIVCACAPVVEALSCMESMSRIYPTVFCIIVALVFMLVGTRSGRVRWINYGMFMAFYVVLAVVTNIFESLENSGAALIIAGGVLMIFVFLSFRLRRHMVRKARQNNQSSTAA